MKKSSKMKQRQVLLREDMIPCETELKQMFKHNITYLPVTVIGQNGLTADFNAELKKTDSGHMSLDVRRLFDIGDFASQMTEYPVSLYKTNSSFKLLITQNNQHPNAVLKRRSAGKISLVLKDVNVPHKNNVATLKPQEKLFRVKVKNKESKHPDGTFIRATTSGNYEFVLEKEFEKLEKEVINDCLGDINECSAHLSCTGSGTCVIDFDDGCNCRQTYHNVLLKKSDSGNIKMVYVSNSNKLKKEKFTIHSNICRVRFLNLYEKLSSFSTNLLKESPKQKDLGRNLECGLKLDTDIKIQIKDQNHFVGELFVSLDKISPGQYSVVFQNKTEELFIGNLLTSCLGRLPVQKSTEQELTIFLNLNKDATSQYGWLRMSNGKVVVVVDNTSVIIQTDSAGSISEKGLTTTCHQKTDCSGCDTSKCCCDQSYSEWSE